MWILLIADIHANKVALDAVLKDAGSVDMIIHAGDIVDYNPWPLETICKVRELNIKSVIGNHDRDTALATPIGYNPYARVSCVWTNKKLTSEAREYLLKLPKKIELTVDDIKLFVCHGSPRDLVDEYIFPPPTTPLEMLRSFLMQTKVDILILGHTHIPFIKKLKEGYVINPGATGQPRDYDPRASYVVMEVVGGKVVSLENKRVEYDVDVVSRQITSCGLPQVLAQRLYNGW